MKILALLILLFPILANAVEGSALIDEIGTAIKAARNDLVSEKTEQGAVFRSSTREFNVYSMDMAGNWVGPNVDVGPNKGGIYIDVQYMAGRYDGQIDMPQVIETDKYVFKERVYFLNDKSGSGYGIIIVRTPKVGVKNGDVAKVDGILRKYFEFKNAD
jgi:hypothetical protein